MLKNKRSLTLILILLVVYAIKAWYYPHSANTGSSHRYNQSTSISQPQTASIDLAAKSDPLQVARYLQAHQQLPDYYISKGDARRRGWVSSIGNLCQILPGRVIGGDNFSNREHRLPDKAGRKWREADVNFSCGRRNSDRLLYASDGLIFLTTDHYRSFKQVP